MTTQPAHSNKLKRFRVLCAVTRSEWYEILAPDEETAGENAFAEGELISTGETTQVTECDVQQVQS